MDSIQSPGQVSIPGERDARFFQPNIAPERIPPAFATLLNEYSKIPSAQQIDHILAVRNNAYNSHPYPCLGRFRFVDLDLAAHPLYHSYILPTLKGFNSHDQKDMVAANTHENIGQPATAAVTSVQRPIFLDLGTCLGQDLRKLIHDGVPPSQLYGADLDTSFVDISYALFKDENTLSRSHFLTGPGCDVLVNPPMDNGNNKHEARMKNDQTLSGLVDLDGRVDILQASMLFHLFSLENQKEAARRCLRLLRKEPSTKKLILGGQAGNINAGESRRYNGEKVFRHNEQSWRDMWDSVAAEDEWKAIGAEVDVWSELVGRNSDIFITSAQEATNVVEPDQDETQTYNGKVADRVMDGARWHVYAVWVQFNNINT